MTTKLNTSKDRARNRPGRVEVVNPNPRISTTSYLNTHIVNKTHSKRKKRNKNNNRLPRSASLNLNANSSVVKVPISITTSKKLNLTISSLLNTDIHLRLFNHIFLLSTITTCNKFVNYLTYLIWENIYVIALQQIYFVSSKFIGWWVSNAQIFSRFCMSFQHFSYNSFFIIFSYQLWHGNFR